LHPMGATPDKLSGRSECPPNRILHPKTWGSNRPHRTASDRTCTGRPARPTCSSPAGRRSTRGVVPGQPPPPPLGPAETPVMDDDNSTQRRIRLTEPPDYWYGPD
jgi:hypothetical protein